MVSRRDFLKGLGALALTPLAGKGILGAAKTAAKVATPEIPHVAGMPHWFPALVNKIKTQGKQTKTATSGRNSENTYTLKSPEGDDYILYEDAVSGNIEIATRGDDFQQVNFEYIPGTEYRRPDGKAFTEDGEFYASEFQKGEFQDFKNPADHIDDLKLGISNIEKFAQSGKKTDAQETINNFLKDTTKEDTDGFALGGRVGYKDGNRVQKPLTKEEYEQRVRMMAAINRERDLVSAANRLRSQGYSQPNFKEGLSTSGYYNSMDDVFFGGINYNNGNKNINIGTVIPPEGQPSYNAEMSFSFANGGPVIRPQGTLPPERGPMHAGIRSLFKQKGTNT